MGIFEGHAVFKFRRAPAGDLRNGIAFMGGAEIYFRVVGGSLGGIRKIKKVKFD